MTKTPLRVQISLFGFDSDYSKYWYGHAPTKQLKEKTEKYVYGILNKFNNDYLLDKYSILIESYKFQEVNTYECIRFYHIDDLKNSFFTLAISDRHRCGMNFGIYTERNNYRCEASSDELEDVIRYIENLVTDISK
jgi:hypothetical protein